MKKFRFKKIYEQINLILKKSNFKNLIYKNKKKKNIINFINN